ncbi:hypothetical protein [Bacillus vallismortis]|uniref:hypothetical protein n=1 Tax=Bacillus vallismortis TaxID=72361 RepID=UPI00209166D3|nr:hypothetical protein [Bacillus vallismortis]MCO4851870.1 hypothetical protein [Bacillus vallismortis]
MKIRVTGILVGITLFMTGILLPEAKFDYPQCISFAGAFIASSSIGSLMKLKKQSVTNS